ncbi:MAG: hypothetical protein OXC55_01440 [Chloroflexi bacterium]|nr:hypothetical protein [Chloroflexota bacterium]
MEFFLLLAINNSDVAISQYPPRPPELRLHQGYTRGFSGEPEIREEMFLRGYPWLIVFALKKTLHPLGIGVGIAGAARIFGFL